MSRCAACDAILTQRDMSRKSALTGQYFDLCRKCFDTIEDQVVAVENDDIPDDFLEESEQNHE